MVSAGGSGIVVDVIWEGPLGRHLGVLVLDGCRRNHQVTVGVVLEGDT